MTEALATKNQNTVIAAIPEHLKGLVGNRAGKENVGRDDILIPRLCLAQGGLSPQLKKQNESYIPGLEEGQLFNSVTGEVYGTEALVIPLAFYKNYIEFKPIEEGGGVVAQYQQASDVKDGGLEWVNGEKPRVTEFKNRICVLLKPGSAPELIAVSFKSTGIKEAKRWNSLIGYINLPAYARTYKLRVITQTKGQQSWYGLKVDPMEFTPADFIKQAEAFFEFSSQAGIKVDVSGLDHEEGPGREAGSDDQPVGF